MLPHYNITTLEFTGAEFALHSLDTAFKFLLPEFSVHTVRLKCTKDTAPPAEFHTKFARRRWTQGPWTLHRARYDELPGTLSLQLCDLGCRSAPGISGKPQPLAAHLSLLCRVCPATAGWALWLSLLGWHGLWEHKTSAGKQQQIQQPPLPLRAEQHHYTLGVPELQAKSLPLQTSLKSSKRNKHRLNPVWQNLAWVQAAYCSLQLCGKTVTWDLHLWALCVCKHSKTHVQDILMHKLCVFQKCGND